MQSAKIEFLTKYNDLVKTALKSHPDFPDILSDFITGEYELEAAVLFKLTETNSVTVLGKSGSAKKSFARNSVFECKNCSCIKSQTDHCSMNVQSDCELQTTDYLIYECCMKIAFDKENALIKLAKKSPFSNVDRDNFKFIGESISSLLSIWTGNHKASAGVSNIVTEIAHELRTPTNSIMGFASLLHEDNLTSSQAEYVTTLKDNAYNLLFLINDLIDIAKFDSGLIKESLVTVNIKNFVEEVVKLFSDKFDKNKIEFLVNFEKNLPESVKADIQKLRYILLNIITNCLRQTERGKIIISVGLQSQNRLSFKISDTSAGLTSAKIRDFFKPFAINEIGNNKIGNTTGLGLTLTKLYIELLNGNIEVSSSLGKGTIYNFFVRIEALGTIEAQLSSLPKPVGKKNRVLVVEDDYATSKLLSNYLNKWGYDPTIVNSADQAIRAIDKEVFLAVLMDIVLPDSNGFELLKTIREHKNSKYTPVIVCSVEAEQQKAFLMGAVEYFVKPIKYKYLVEVLTSYRLKKDSNILIVDDDVPTLNLIKEAVQQAGFNAIAEAHSSKVYNMIENMALDLAIVDLDMPELNGFDLIKQIKSNVKFSKLPIIIYTGKENYSEDLKKIDGLFADLLNKNSSNIEDLAETINQMINRYDEPTPPQLAPLNVKKEGVSILLVEDYKHSQIIVTRLLKKNNFESIVVVENGAEAVDQVKKQKFDLILMDMQMPVMNGFEATEKIRQMAEYKDIPIIALTAFAMKGDREKCLEAGATDYIAKPIDSQEFIEKVKYYTESKVNVS